MELTDALSFLGGRKWGVLATIKRDGRPQLSNIAFAVGGDGLVRISVTAPRAKVHNLRRDPRASLHVTTDDFFRYVVIEGEVDLSAVAAAPDDPVVDELVELYRAVAGEHPDWDDYRRAMVADQRLVARLSPERAYGLV